MCPRIPFYMYLWRGKVFLSKKSKLLNPSTQLLTANGIGHNEQYF